MRLAIDMSLWALFMLWLRSHGWFDFSLLKEQARRGVEVGEHPLREIEELWDDDLKFHDGYPD